MVAGQQVYRQFKRRQQARQVRVLGGAAGYPSGEAPVLAEDQILLCQAIPREDMIIDC